MLNLTNSETLLSPIDKAFQNKKYLLAFGGLCVITLLVGLLLCFGVNPAHGNRTNNVLPVTKILVGQKALAIMKQPINSLSWKSYSVNDEGLYVLKIKDDSTIPLERLLQDFHVYISANSLSNEATDSSKKIFIPSSGETLIELDLLKLFREEGINISFKAKSLIYMVSSDESSIPALQIYKLGPASPVIASAANNANIK